VYGGKKIKKTPRITQLHAYAKYDSTTAFSKSVTDIKDQATILLDTLNLERLSPTEVKRPLIFIAHSLGGVVVKKVWTPRF